jgi:UDP-N-acetylglucosamine/UDP-N-acetylgalactosamine 4-epimerase
MDRFLVTGGAGFIGSALTRGLLSQGADRVIVVDNLLSGHARNIEEICGAIDFKNIDILDYDALLASMKGVDVVFHEAAIPSVPRSINEPIPSHDVNVNGTFNVLRAAKEAGVRRVVYAASSSAYGDSLTLPKVETMPTNPKSPYAAQKLMGEHYMSVWASCFGLETISLRYFNVFGPRQDPDGAYAAVIPRFVAGMLQGMPVVIHGDGETTRDFCYVDNVVQANVLAATVDRPEALGQVYNVAVGARMSLNELYRVLGALIAGRHPGLEIPAPIHDEFRIGDVAHSEADISKAMRLLGYRPGRDAKSGLADALPWYELHSSPTVSDVACKANVRRAM